MKYVPSFARLCPSCRSNHIKLLRTDAAGSGKNAPIRRRKRCLDCNNAWTTYEIAADSYKAVAELSEKLKDALGSLQANAPNL